MPVTFKACASALALTATVLPQIAMAQANCITRTEMSAMALYAVPGVVKGIQAKCANTLSQNGYLARDGGNFAARYAALRSNAWPNARSGILKYLSAKAGQGQQNVALLANLPEQTAQPLLDALIVQEIGPRLQTRDCRTVELMLQNLAQVEPTVAANLIGLAGNFIAKNESLLCPADQ